MASVIKKGLVTAIGTASIAAEKAEKILKDIKKKGLISTKDARSLVNRLVKEAEREGKRVKQIISEELRKQAKKTRPIVSKSRAKAKKAISRAKKAIKKAQKTAHSRGKNVIKKAVKRLR